MDCDQQFCTKSHARSHFRYWQSFADHLPDLIIQLDPHRRYVFVNRRWSEATGIPPEACYGKTSREIGLPAALCEILDFACQRVVADRAQYEFQFPFFGPQGEQHFLSRVIPEFDSQGELLSTLSITQDITDRVKMEAALSESENRFQSFMDHSPAIAWMKDETGKYVFVNRRQAQRLSIPPEVWHGKTDADLWPANVAAQLLEHDLEVLRDGQTREVIEEGRRPDGSDYAYHMFKFLMQDLTGKKYVGGTGVDITAQRTAAREVARLAAIVDSSHDAIISKTLDGMIQTWNRSAERIFGYCAAEMIGRNISVLIPLELQSEETQILARVRAGIPVDHYETIRVRKDGSRIPVSLTVSPISDERGTVIAASKIVRDLTAARRGTMVRLAQFA